MIFKICGLTTLADALAAVDAGASMLGFNFYPPSPRFIAPDLCAQITSVLKEKHPEVIRVGVFVNSSLPEVTRILDACTLDLAQCSGDEPPALLYKLGPRAFKALRPTSEKDLQNLLGIFPVRSTPPAYLVDAYRPGEYGGTGQSADWGLAARLARKYPILLAGGLNPGNIARAVTQVRPWGVDVASGVEEKPGLKSPAKMNDFIQNAREAEEEYSS